MTQHQDTQNDGMGLGTAAGLSRTPLFHRRFRCAWEDLYRQIGTQALTIGLLAPALIAMAALLAALLASAPGPDVTMAMMVPGP